jgi:hypothetical protein
MNDVVALDSARLELGLTLHDLWVAYFALGGCCDSRALGAYLDGTGTTTDADHDVIVHALNETFVDRGGNHPMPYRRP